jgi:hypothetical protein
MSKPLGRKEGKGREGRKEGGERRKEGGKAVKEGGEGRW